MPVDQTGENILFVIDQGQVEVHIQIQYDPDTNPQQFAWMIPLPEVPDFAVGSELLNATVPTYGISDIFEFCGGGTGTGEGGTDSGFPASTSAASTSMKIQTVGAFEVVVLGGMNAGEIMQWLGDNGYQQDPDADSVTKACPSAMKASTARLTTSL